jgi:hypothetical protein
LQGAKTAAGLPYATWSNFDPASGAVTTPSTPYVRYGTLVVGDPFIPKIKENNRLITGPHLSLELDYGYFGGPGIYASYRFQGIVLKDSNPKLPQPLVFKVSGPDVDKYLKTVSSHHSLSDEFIITLPEATYHLGGAASGVRITYADASIPVEVVPMDCNYLVECGKLLSGPSTGQ